MTENDEEYQNPYATPEYQAFVSSMIPHCHCAERYRPCDGVLAGGVCDRIKDERDEYDAEELNQENDNE